NLSLGQPYVASAAAVFLISGYYERLRWKYGERAFRYMCMDVGFLAQNIYLVGEALKLGVCAIAGFVDDAVEDLLGINGQDEVGLLLVTVGSL
ncbi:MAG: SagB/ThcOx family dehydrogenase, partial [Caldilineaceae bacterium]|nr:SagB/ThcOx family dehydrogenase [Caldilineaceae bacterium]